MAVRVTEQAIRIHGGAGIMREYPVGRFHRDVAGLCHRRGDFGNPAQHHLRLAEVPVMTFRAVRFSITYHHLAVADFLAKKPLGCVWERLGRDGEK